MRRGGTVAALNAESRTFIDFDPDPRGIAYAAKVNKVATQPIAGMDGHIYQGDKGSAQRSFNGYADALTQKFLGAAALGFGGAAPTTAGLGKNLTDATADSPLNNSLQNIWANRALARMRGVNP